jgi:hypothetical protein
MQLSFFYEIDPSYLLKYSIKATFYMCLFANLILHLSFVDGTIIHVLDIEVLQD